MKRRPLLYLSPIVLCLSMMTGCAKRNDLPDTDHKKKSDVKTELAGDGRFDLLGYGYNVTGEYANAVSAANAVLDIAKLESEHPEKLIMENTRSQEYVEEYGENALQYSKKMSTKVEATVSYAVFKATISYSFNSTDVFNSKYIYGSYNFMIKHKRVRLNATTDNLTNYLTPGFTSALQSMTAAQLVNTYGTHVLVDLYTGARMEMIYQSETTNESRETAARAGIKASVSSVFGLDVSNEVDVNNAKQNFSKKLSYRTRGGDPSKGLVGEINLDQNNPKINITAWQSSSTPDNAVLVDIAPKGLTPLYELITDVNKRTEVENYIKQYLNDNQVNLSYSKAPVHCYYNPGSNKHTYELDRRLDNDNNWNYKGIYFYAYKDQAPGTVPVYHFYAPSTGDNQYSLSTNNDYSYWTLKGVKFYAYSSQQLGSVPIYQFYHHTTREEHFLGSNPNSASPANEWTKYIVFYAH